MAQQYQEDAVQNSSPTTVTTTTETTGVTGNFLNPPFGTCKVVLTGFIALTVGTGTTTVTLRIRRNPSGENTIVVNYTLVNVTAGNVVLLPVFGTDALPDGRSVQYAITVQQAGATGNGSIVFAFMNAEIISG